MRLYIRFVDPGTVVSYHHQPYHHLEEDVGEEGDGQGKDGEKIQCEADDLVNPMQHERNLINARMSKSDKYPEEQI